MAPGIAQYRLRTSDEYITSLRDSRRVFYRGEPVADVTAHPVLGIAVRHAALDYEMADDPRFRDLAIAEEGYSRYFKFPVSSADLRSHDGRIRRLPGSAGDARRGKH